MMPPLFCFLLFFVVRVLKAAYDYCALRLFSLLYTHVEVGSSLFFSQTGQFRLFRRLFVVCPSSVVLSVLPVVCPLCQCVCRYVWRLD